MTEPTLLSENVLDATEEFDEAYDIAAAALFRRRIKDLDPRLDLIFVKEGAKHFPISPRWYIIRRNELVTPTFWVIETPEGEYCMPTELHYQGLLKLDTWSSRRSVVDEVKAKQERKKRDKEKRKAALSEQFRETLLDRLEHLANPRVAVPELPASMEDADA